MKNTTEQQFGTDNASRKIEETLEAGKKYADNITNEYGHRMKESFDVAKEKARVASDEVNHWVQKHPLASLGVALGAGIIMGRLFLSTTKKE